MKLLFLLHPNVGSVSNFVRALQYKYDERIECIDFSQGHFSKTIVGLTKGGLYYLVNMCKLCFFKRNEYDGVILVKPWSLLVAFFLKFFFGKKLYVDVNDPLHLPIFLGNFRFSLLLKSFNEKIIFESAEYKNYCKDIYGVEGCLVDDYSQWEDLKPISISEKKAVIYWYGDSLLSHMLIEYIDFLKTFSSTGGTIKLTGADSTVLHKLIDSGVSVHVPLINSREDFLNELASSKFVFVPFDKNSALHTLRGNLKAKIAMAAGCVVIAQNIAMHQRLIINGENGWLFDDANSLKSIVGQMEYAENFESMSQAARATAVKMGSRENYLERYIENTTQPTGG